MVKKLVDRGFLKRFKADAGGGVGVLIALALPVVIGSVGLAFDLNRGLEQRIINQRAADMGALAAAMAYKDSNTESILNPTAIDLARVNGLSEAVVSALILNDYPNEGDQSVQVTVTSQLPYTLARVLGLTGNYGVAATSAASLVTQVPPPPPCFLALADDDNALVTSGGASINAPKCSVAAVGKIYNGGSFIKAYDLISGSSSIETGWSTVTVENMYFADAFITPAWYGMATVTNQFKQSTNLEDSWSTDTDLINARAELGSFTASPTLSDPDTSCSGAENLSLEYSPNGNDPAKKYFVKSGSEVEYNFPSGVYCFKKLTVGGGVKVSFADGSNISIDQGFSNGGSVVNFGNSNLLVNGGFDSGSSGVTIGDGVLWIGQGNIKFQGTNTKGNGNVIVNDTLSLGGGQKFTMGSGQHLFGAVQIGGGGWANIGDGDFVAVKGVDIGGDSELSLGDGNVIIGSDANGNGSGNNGDAIRLSGSARFFMGDGEFSANGDIDTNGGSRLVFGKTDNHYINGDMRIAGAVLFGSGRYTINGDFRNGTGGTVWPYTSALTNKTYGSESFNGFDMIGVDVTFILAGTVDLAGGAKTNFVAASTNSGGAIADLIFDTLTTDDINWAAGATNVLNGFAHFPNSDVKMSGGTSVTDANTNFCFRLVANHINLSGGATAYSGCSNASTSTSTTSSVIRLVK